MFGVANQEHALKVVASPLNQHLEADQQIVSGACKFYITSVADDFFSNSLGKFTTVAAHNCLALAFGSLPMC